MTGPRQTTIQDLLAVQFCLPSLGGLLVCRYKETKAAK